MPPILEHTAENRLSTYVSDEQLEAFKQLARREQTTVAELLRRAVREMLERAA